MVRKREGDGRTDGPSNCRKKGERRVWWYVVAAGVVHGDGTEVGMCELRNIFSRQADDDGKRGCKKDLSFLLAMSTKGWENSPCVNSF